MFFDIFQLLCTKKGVSCKKAAEDIGLSNSITTKWKKTGATPGGETLNRISAYFDVSVDYLLGNEKAPAETGKRKEESVNIIKIAGRDGSFRERRLTDQQLAALTLILDQMPDVPEDL